MPPKCINVIIFNMSFVFFNATIPLLQLILLRFKDTNWVI